MGHRITLLPGDGIGPEVTGAVVAILESTGVEFEWDQHSVGAEAAARVGNPLPPDVLESIRANRVGLKGPVTTPTGGGFQSVNVQLRKKLDLYANLGLESAVFETVHGSAPDIAGLNVANPTALLQSAVLMLLHLGESQAASWVDQALLATLTEGLVRTRDIGGKSSTTEFTSAIISEIRRLRETS